MLVEIQAHTVPHFKATVNSKRRIGGLERAGTYIQPKTKLYNHLALQFSDFQLKSFVDPKPVEL